MILHAAVGLVTVGAKSPQADKQFPLSMSVIEHGARADGTTDDTEAFQNTLNSIASTGGIVLVPTGTYLIAGSLNIPAGVTLRGVWEAPHHADIGKGTIIYATGNAGDENGPPLIKLNQSSCVRGITVLYPEQDIDHIKPYPWTIQGSGMHGSVIDVTLVNPYKAIDFGTHKNELHHIRNVFGCPLKIGIFVDQCTDIGRIENIHFNPHAWVRAAHPSAPRRDQWKKLCGYLLDNLVGFIISRTDWEYMSNCFVIFPKIGFHFLRTSAGEPNAVLTQCGSDIGPIAVQVDACQSHSGVAFTNCQFMSTIVVGAQNQGPVKFSNCGFWEIDSTDNQAIIEGSGTVIFTSCHFSEWAQKDLNAACIELRQGSMIVNGCDFLAENKKQIFLGPKTESAAIFGNRLRGGDKIVNEAPANASIQIGMNIR